MIATAMMFYAASKAAENGAGMELPGGNMLLTIMLDGFAFAMLAVACVGWP